MGSASRARCRRRGRLEIEQLRATDTYWLSTVRSDGRPHVTPLIAVWHAEALWFATGPDERKARNLSENPSCVLTTGRSALIEGALDLVLEGRAEQVTDDAELEPVAIAFADKYPTGPWDFVVRNGAFSDRGAGGRVIVFRVRPMRGLGFRKGDRFSQTTWRGFRYARTPKQPRGADRPRCRSRDTAPRLYRRECCLSRAEPLLVTQ